MIFFVVFLGFSSYSASLRAVKKNNGKVVFTNLSRNLFFVRAFRHASSKDNVLGLIKKISEKYGVSYRLVEAIAKIESNYNVYALSHKGAKGVMQLMSSTAKFYGVTDPYNVKENIEAGVRFLKHLVSKYHDVRLVAAAYNAGETAVDRYGGVPPFPETEKYVKKFLDIYHGNKYLYSRKIYKVKHSRKIRKINGVYTNLGYSLW